MPFCNPHQLRLHGLLLGSVFLLSTVGASATLLAQQPRTTDVPAASELATLATSPTPLPGADAPAELPDAPSALLYPQSGQSSSNPDPADPTNNDHDPKITTN